MSLGARSRAKAVMAKRKATPDSPRLPVLFSALLVIISVGGARDHPTASLAALLVAAASAGVSLLGPIAVNRHDWQRRVEWALVVPTIIVGLILTAGTLSQPFANLASLKWIAAASAYTILGLAAAFPLTRKLPLKWAFWLFLGAHTVMSVVFLRATPAAIDVQVFLHDGANALLHGHNAYSMTFPNIYPSPRAELFYGPGVVVDGRVTYGFPYPPVGLLGAVPGYLLGDVRYSQLIAMLVTAVVLRRLASDRIGQAAAILAVAAPTAIPMLTGAWTEPTLVALLACTVFALERRRDAVLAVLLALFLVTKQYVVVVIPTIWLIRQSLTRRMIFIVLSVATAVTLPFFLVNPAAFWKAIVKFQLVQPFRADSLSLLVSTVNTFGWPPPRTYGVLPLVGGGLTAVTLAFRSARTPAAFAAGVGLSLLVTILLSKQAFMNYYFIVSGAFLIAAVAWPMRQPLAVPGPRS